MNGRAYEQMNKRRKYLMCTERNNSKIKLFYSFQSVHCGHGGAPPSVKKMGPKT